MCNGQNIQKEKQEQKQKEIVVEQAQKNATVSPRAVVKPEEASESAAKKRLERARTELRERFQGQIKD